MSFGSDTVDEIEQRCGHAFAAMGGERLGGEPAGNPTWQDAVASGAEMRPDHGGVRSLAPETGMDRLEHAVRATAGFELGSVRKDHDVDRPGAGAIDLLSQPAPVGRRGRKLCRRVDVDRIGAQRSDRPVDDRSCLGSGHENERRCEGGREQEQPFHGPSRACARLRAP